MRIFNGLLGLVLATLAMSAFAVPITGQLDMGGNFFTVDQNWNLTGTASATGIDFNPNLFIVNKATGSFAGVSTIGSITDFQFDPGLGVNDGFGGVTSVSSIAGFWSIGGFSFELTSIVQGVTNDPNNFLVLNGTGVITAPLYTATIGSWSLTGDTTNAGTFTWSAASAAVSSVPEPGILALLSIGLVGFAGRKKYRNF